ncbi:hypothetical protein JCM10213_007471 [Rhodosporidiobolus nylandii]
MSAHTQQTSAPRAPADPAVRTQRLYRTLHDQLSHDPPFLPQALRTCTRLLLLDPADPLALRTRQQVLIALDRFAEALEASADAQEGEVARAYCLYKLGRAGEALRVLEQEEERAEEEQEEEEDRAREVLKGQVLYRLGSYSAAQSIFEDLSSTAEPDSPESPDLTSNATACTTRLTFLSSVPSTLAALPVPSTSTLETQPLSVLLPPLRRVPLPAASSSAAAAAAPAPEKKKGRRSRPLPARALASPPAPLPAEDRWIPLRQRPSMRDALLQAKERQRGRKREKVLGGLTQGAEPVKEEKREEKKPAGKGAGGGGGAGGKGGKKKGKGRK